MCASCVVPGDFVNTGSTACCVSLGKVMFSAENSSAIECVLGLGCCDDGCDAQACPTTPQPHNPTTTQASISHVPSFLRVTCGNEPQRAAQFWSCSAAQVATVALAVATRAAVDRSGPATSLHHSALRGQEKARAGEWRSEQNYTATIRRTPSPAGALRWNGFCGTPRSRLVMSLPSCLLSVFLSRRWCSSWWPEQIIAVPKISLPSRPLRAALVATRMVEQLVQVPTDVVVLMETDTEDEEEEEERRAWIDDNVGAWVLIRPTGRRPYWWNICQDFSQWHPPWETPPGQGGI